MFGSFGLAFWYGSKRYTDGAIDNPGTVIVVLMSVMLILTSFERITTPLMAVSKAMVAACELFSLIDAPRPPLGILKPEITGEDILFQDVTFEYPRRPGVQVLDNLSVRIQSGRNTALVGPSGSGKSTIIALLLRWYTLQVPQVIEQPKEEKSDDQPDNTPESPDRPKRSGTIMVGGHSLEDIDPQWWRTQIGLVQQEPFLFNDTIFRNVANGLIGTEWADEPEAKKREMVLDACQEVHAHEFINRLPDVSRHGIQCCFPS